MPRACHGTDPNLTWTMSSISIPVDILRAILEHLDRGDLAKICLLNKICCSCSQDILYRDIYLPRNLVCHTLAQSTLLARRVRSFTMRCMHTELSKALRNMTCLRSLKLLIFDGSSNVLDGCTFNLDTFTCGFPYNDYLLKFLRSQPCLREAHFLTPYSLPELLDLEPTCIPNLTRITAPYTWLPYIVPGRPVSEIASIGYRVGNPIDFSFFALSTVPIQKFETSYFPLTNTELIASIFPSLMHLTIEVFLKISFFQKVCAIFFY